MTTLMNGLMVPAWLIIDKTRTKEINDDGVERQEAVYQHKSAKITYRLLSDEEIKEEKKD